jgi:putative transcriptional regulator
MTTSFDPSQHVFDHVLGTLGADDQRRMDEALAAAPDLRRQVDETAAALLAAAVMPLTPIAPDARVRQRLLASIESAERESPERFRPFFTEIARLLALPLEVVRALVAKIDDPASWRLIKPGISMLGIPLGAELAGSGADASFLRLAPGVRFPRHRHVGTELALVLEGSGHDGDGQAYAPGQLVSHAPGSSHDFVAGTKGDLLLVVVHRGISFG